MASEQEAPYKATNCAGKISHSLARPDTDQEGQSLEDNQSHVGKNTEPEYQTYSEIFKTDQQDNSTEEEEEEERKKPPDLQNEVASV